VIRAPLLIVIVIGWLIGFSAKKSEHKNDLGQSLPRLPDHAVLGEENRLPGRVPAPFRNRHMRLTPQRIVDAA
jgi:hypothetical protein